MRFKEIKLEDTTFFLILDYPLVNSAAQGWEMCFPKIQI